MPSEVELRVRLGRQQKVNWVISLENLDSWYFYLQSWIHFLEMCKIIKMMNICVETNRCVLCMFICMCVYLFVLCNLFIPTGRKTNKKNSLPQTRNKLYSLVVGHTSVGEKVKKGIKWVTHERDRVTRMPCHVIIPTTYKTESFWNTTDP